MYTKCSSKYTPSIARPSKNHPNLDFWFENSVAQWTSHLPQEKEDPGSNHDRV
jgi:hypothetical protein